MISIILPIAYGTAMVIPLDITSNPIAAASLYLSGWANDNILLKSFGFLELPVDVDFCLTIINSIFLTKFWFLNNFEPHIRCVHNLESCEAALSSIIRSVV